MQHDKYKNLPLHVIQQLTTTDDHQNFKCTIKCFNYYQKHSKLQMSHNKNVIKELQTLTSVWGSV